MSSPPHNELTSKKNKFRLKVPFLSRSSSRTQNAQDQPTEDSPGKLAWRGVELLLKNVEKFLDGTPFKTPISVLNILIDVGNAVVDNKSDLKNQVTRTVNRLDIVNNASVKAEVGAVKDRLLAFAEKLIKEAIMLQQMSKNATWKKILDNEEDKNKIAGSFKRIDEYTKDFHLDIVMSIERKTDELQELLLQQQLSNWPSRKALYNADLGGTEAITREPCTEGTRVAILKRLYQWAEDSSPNSPPIFWLTGQAGSGKSTIACSVAAHFDGEDESNIGSQTILQANFFCSRQFEETRRQKYILPTLAWQLARQSRSYAYALHQAKKFNSVDVFPKQLAKQMKNLLVGPWQKSASERPPELPPYLVIVDALDEIEGQEGLEFLQNLLNTIKNNHLRGLKFLVTSRPDPKLVELCQSFPSDAVCHLYDVDKGDIEPDIITYLKAKLPLIQDESELAELAQKADGLFIYAATAVRYATPRQQMAKNEQLELLHKLIHPTSGPMTTGNHTLLIDQLYQQVLWDAFRDIDEEVIQPRLHILHTFLCTEEHLSASVIAALLSDSEERTSDFEERIQIVLNELHAVLYTKDGRVLWYHASFPDFIFTQTRSRFSVPSTYSNSTNSVVDMSCDEASHHALLTRCCFNIMSRLHFNICNLPSSFLLDSEIPDLSHRVQENISEILRYSCQYWVQHLSRTATDHRETLHTCIRDFLPECVLFWMEVMNLLQLHAQCSPMLKRACEWVLRCDDTPSDLEQGLVEAANFATYFTGSKAALSTAHLYISSLATWVSDSTLSQGWKRQFSLIPAFKHTKGSSTVPLMTIITASTALCLSLSSDGTCIISGSLDGSVQVWDASTGVELRTLNGHTDSVHSVAFSSDGTCIVSGSSDHSVRVWDASTGVELRTLNGHTKGVNSVAFSTDGTRI
ncbi:hypothetical protein M422DRAFT_775760, partial [Sphaerobolus stellatus SS14]